MSRIRNKYLLVTDFTQNIKIVDILMKQKEIIIKNINDLIYLLVIGDMLYMGFKQDKFGYDIIDILKKEEDTHIQWIYKLGKQQELVKNMLHDIYDDKQALIDQLTADIGDIVQLDHRHSDEIKYIYMLNHYRSHYDSCINCPIFEHYRNKTYKTDNIKDIKDIKDITHQIPLHPNKQHLIDDLQIELTHLKAFYDSFRNVNDPFNEQMMQKWHDMKKQKRWNQYSVYKTIGKNARAYKSNVFQIFIDSSHKHIINIKIRNESLRLLMQSALIGTPRNQKKNSQDKLRFYNYPQHANIDICTRLNDKKNNFNLIKRFVLLCFETFHDRLYCRYREYPVQILFSGKEKSIASFNDLPYIQNHHQVTNKTIYYDEQSINQYVWGILKRRCDNDLDYIQIRHQYDRYYIPSNKDLCRWIYQDVCESISVDHSCNEYCVQRQY